MPFHLKTDVAIFRATLGIIWGIAYYSIGLQMYGEKHQNESFVENVFSYFFQQTMTMRMSWPVKVLQFFLKKIWILFSPTHCLLTLIWSLLSAISIQQTLGTDRKDIIWLESVKMGASATRFGDTVPLWQSFKSVWQFLKPSLAFVEILNLIG